MQVRITDDLVKPLRLFAVDHNTTVPKVIDQLLRSNGILGKYILGYRKGSIKRGK